MPDTRKSPPSLASDDALHEHLSWIDRVNSTIASCYSWVSLEPFSVILSEGQPKMY